MEPDAYPDHPTPGMHVWGWTAPPELDWLRETAATMESVVEVGSLRGRSAFALLTGCPGPVYCIDPWSDPKDVCFTAFMDACGHFPNLVPVRGLSPAVASEVPGKVDMVFIDGAHDYDSVVADIEAWLPKTKKLICGHDYSDIAGYPGVKQAVDERFGERDKDWELAPLTSIWTVWLTS